MRTRSSTKPKAKKCVFFVDMQSLSANVLAAIDASATAWLDALEAMASEDADNRYAEEAYVTEQYARIEAR